MLAELTDDFRHWSCPPEPRHVLEIFSGCLAECDIDDVEFDTAVISEWIERASAYLSDDDASDTRALSGFLRLGSPFMDSPDLDAGGRAICRLEGKA